MKYILEKGIQYPRILGRGGSKCPNILTGCAKYPRGMGVPVFLGRIA